eukprot:scaffold98587_cov17-Tisochrysis_lutea.AAC.2
MASAFILAGGHYYTVLLICLPMLALAQLPVANAYHRRRHCYSFRLTLGTKYACFALLLEDEGYGWVLCFDVRLVLQLRALAGKYRLQEKKAFQSK